MTHLQNLEQSEEVPEGSYDIVINNFFAIESCIWIVSAPFEFGRSQNTELVIGEVILSPLLQPYRLLYLKFNVHRYFSVFSKSTRYKICLLDPSGIEILSESGIVSLSDCPPIISMCLNLLVIEGRMLPESPLRIRLSWFSWNKNSIEETQTTKDFTAEKSERTLLKKLLSDIKLFCDAKPDCFLKVGSMEIPAHQAVLSARSVAFSAIFQHTKSKTPKVYIGSKIAVLDGVLKYMYSGKIHGLNTETAASMYKFADEYAMTELRDKCLDFLKNNLTIGNVCDVADLCHTYGETKLEEVVFQFMEDRHEDICQSNEWKHFLNREPSLAVKYLASLLAKRTRKTI